MSPFNNSMTSNGEYIFRPFNFEKVSPHGNCLHPEPRSGHRIVSNDLYIYSFGGFNPSIPSDSYLTSDPIWQSCKPLFQELWRFSKITRTWTYLKTDGDPPKELASHCALLADPNTLLVYGGSGMPFGQASSNKMYTCNLNTLVWSQVNYMNEVLNEMDQCDIPQPAYGQAMVIDEQRRYLYVCGGTTGFDYSLDVHRFDLHTCQWRKLSSTPSIIEPRYRHEMAIYENKLYIICGGTSSESFSNDTIPVFNLDTRIWSKEQAMPYVDSQGNHQYCDPRYSHDCGQIGHLMYVVGGANESKIFDDLWCLNLKTLAWTKFENSNLPKPVYFHSASISEQGQLCIFGGVTSLSRKERTNTIYSAWVQIPKLQTMAMNAIMVRLASNDYHYQQQQQQQQLNNNEQETTLRRRLTNAISTAAASINTAMTGTTAGHRGHIYYPSIDMIRDYFHHYCISNKQLNLPEN